MTKNCFVMGDFNLHAKMELRPDCSYKIPLSHLTTFVTLNNLNELVDFTAWSKLAWTRTINGVRKESTLDHFCHC